jgi:hypothetical protein
MIYWRSGKVMEGGGRNGVVNSKVNNYRLSHFYVSHLNLHGLISYTTMKEKRENQRDSDRKAHYEYYMNNTGKVYLKKKYRGN